jgi:hypothetical protein
MLKIHAMPLFIEIIPEPKNIKKIKINIVNKRENRFLIFLKFFKKN